MSATVFAGSAQFVVIDLWTEPAPWLFVALTTLLVNVRHVLMGASLAGKLGAFSDARSQAGGGARFMVDETWAMAERRAMEAQAFHAWLIMPASPVPLYANWVICTCLGAAFGHSVSDPETYGFDFAFTAIFIGILTGFWRGTPTALVLAASSAAAVGIKLAVSGPWYILAGGLAGVVAAVTAWRPERQRATEAGP